MCEGPALYTVGVGLGIFNVDPEPRPGWKSTILANMEWSMVTSFSGPFAEAFYRNYRSRRDRRLAALFSCGGSGDYDQAEAVLADYKKASKRRYGIRHFEDRAWELVVGNQSAIDALASQLVQHESLDYEDAHKIAAPLLGTLTRRTP
jgi:hypothetical protein